MAIGSDNGRTPAGGFRRNPCRILNVLGKNWDRISRYIRQMRLANYKCLDSQSFLHLRIENSHYISFHIMSAKTARLISTTWT